MEMDATGLVLDMVVSGWGLLGLLARGQTGGDDSGGTVARLALPVCAVWGNLVSRGPDGCGSPPSSQNVMFSPVHNCTE